MTKVFKAPENLTIFPSHGECPGCGHGISTRIIFEVVEEMGMMDKVVAFHDVACGADFLLYVADGAWFFGNGNYIGAEEYTFEPVQIMKGVHAVFAAGQTAMLISNGRGLYVFGASGNEGRLGIDTAEWITEPKENGLIMPQAKGIPGISASGAIDENECLYVWGTLYNLFSTFSANGLPASVYNEGALINYGKTPILLYSNVKDCAIGDAFVVLEFTDGSLFTWGANEWGQAGDGYYTVFSVNADADDDEDAPEIIIDDNQQRIFPATPAIAD